MERGWDASGRLAPLWAKVGGRDGLAALTGIGGTTLSGYNSGSKRLGHKNGALIAEALGVTVEDLGAPPHPGGTVSPIVPAAEIRARVRAEVEEQIAADRAELTRLAATVNEIWSRLAEMTDWLEELRAQRQDPRQAGSSAP